jgi:hypothetical protein
MADAIEGRKKIQKIVYILQNEGVEFEKDYKYANFGPYSVDIQLELNFLVQRKVLIEMLEESTYTYSYNSKNTYYPIGDKEIDKQIRSKESLIRFLNLQNSSELEVLSTIYFIKNKGKEYDDNEIVRRKIVYLKPHLKDKFDDSIRLFEKIRNKKFN